MKKILLGACAVVLMAGFAMAQTATNAPPPPPPGQQMDGPDQQGGWGGWWGHGRRHGWRGDHGERMSGEGGPGGPDGPGRLGLQRDGKGFGLMVGRGHGLHVNCGEEPMKDCIAAAQPLIDALGKLDFKMPPPPAGAVAPAQ